MNLTQSYLFWIIFPCHPLPVSVSDFISSLCQRNTPVRLLFWWLQQNEIFGIGSQKFYNGKIRKVKLHEISAHSTSRIVNEFLIIIMKRWDHMNRIFTLQDIRVSPPQVWCLTYDCWSPYPAVRHRIIISLICDVILSVFFTLFSRDSVLLLLIHLCLLLGLKADFPILWVPAEDWKL